MSETLTPDPWEYPPVLKNAKKDYSTQEVFSLIEEFGKRFDYAIGFGFVINEECAPVIAYALEHDDPDFYKKWERQVAERSVTHGLLF